MSRQIICTVGTSLLTNMDRPWAGWKHSVPLPDANEVIKWLQTCEIDKASAETNTIRTLELADNDVLALLHSETKEGKFCAVALSSLYTPILKRGVSIEEIGKLGYGATSFTSGLKALVDVSLRLVDNARANGLQPIFCATGGFKAEIAFLNIIGALLEIEVVYIHELHRELVRLPRLPLAWNYEFVCQHEDFFEWIEQEPRPSTEVESWLKGRPELRSLVEDGNDDNTYLTAAGALLFKTARDRSGSKPRATWPDADLKPPREKDHVSKVEHHRAAGWERFVERVCAIDCVSNVRYDAAAHSSERVKILDAEEGAIGICFGAGDNVLPLRVETTARTPPQLQLVADYLKNTLKKFGK